ncbi:carbohydrate kinase family protein [Empedobacter brevis]|uniref:carbohydrate kinase family protein n=1 Tax=Empedobacter brevis TaxID=247 RepID=UPI0039B0F0AC
MSNLSNTVFCFGEVLWDIFPSGAKVGGAPFNVAYNLKKMGVEPKILTRVGQDDLGISLRKQIKNWGLDDQYVQEDPNHNTGTVIADFDERGEAKYDIIYPVAYDFIEINNTIKEEISNSEAFVFGSLISRHSVSANSLFEALEASNLKIFDVNLREPYCDFKVIEQLLHKSDIVKMNKAELRSVLAHINVSYESEYDSVRFFQDHYKVSEVLISKGSKGALYYDGNQDYFAEALHIEVGDTVGSGDAFLAGFISKRIIKAAPQIIMQRAVELGAFITTKLGACPEYNFKDFEKFSESHKI